GTGQRGDGIAQRGGAGRADAVRVTAVACGMNAPSALTAEALAATGKAQTPQELDQLETDYLGRKSGRVSKLLEGIGGLSPEERAALGKAVNEAKRTIEAALAARRAELDSARIADLAE